MFKGMLSELNLQKELADQSQKKLKSEIAEMKEDRKRDCEVLENKLRASEISKAEMSARE